MPGRPQYGADLLNGGHGVTAQMLLAGKPLLQIPLVREQGLTAEAVYAEGVVRFAEPRPRVAPGQSVVLYRGDEVLGGGIARRFALGRVDPPSE